MQDPSKSHYSLIASPDLEGGRSICKYRHCGAYSGAAFLRPEASFPPPWAFPVACRMSALPSSVPPLGAPSSLLLFGPAHRYFGRSLPIGRSPSSFATIPPSQKGMSGRSKRSSHGRDVSPFPPVRPQSRQLHFFWALETRLRPTGERMGGSVPPLRPKKRVFFLPPLFPQV